MQHEKLLKIRSERETGSLSVSTASNFGFLWFPPLPRFPLSDADDPPVLTCLPSGGKEPGHKIDDSVLKHENEGSDSEHIQWPII